MINKLCGRFTALSPLEVLKEELSVVYDLWVDCVIHDSKENGNNQAEEWVTSKTAGWH